MVSPAEIGAAIAVARERGRLTQEELAALSGRSERTLREVEKGTGRTSRSSVLGVARAVGVSLRLED